MKTDMAIKRFVRDVSREHHPALFNPWGQNCAHDLHESAFTDRQQRLASHLNCPAPKLLLIGEAPGYQGCRYSGVAFTSERLLLTGEIPRVQADRRITDRKLPWSEPSSTIVWKALYELGVAENVVMFNAVPWHPMGAAGAHSNRSPTACEQDLAIPFLEALTSIYDGVQIAALGNIAKSSLNRIGKAHAHIRHPANGGARLFRDGLFQLLNKQTR